MRILLVEDDALVAKATRIGLEQAGSRSTPGRPYANRLVFSQLFVQRHAAGFGIT